MTVKPILLEGTHPDPYTLNINLLATVDGTRVLIVRGRVPALKPSCTVYCEEAISWLFIADLSHLRMALGTPLHSI
jgi:hypothetical protein